MQVFISSSSRSKKWAEKLAEDLRQNGLSPWFDRETLLPGMAWRGQIEKALGASKYVVTLFDSSGDLDESQRQTISEVLNAVWQGEDKRLIPILLRDAKLPDLMHTAVSNGGVRAIRISDPRREWKDAVMDVVAIIRDDKDLADAKLAEVSELGERPKKAHAQRLSYIAGVADTLKADD